MPSVTMQQLADSLDLSVSTVSLALRGKEVIAAKTRDRIHREAARLGYVYNRSAANLRQSRRTLVGLVVPDITNPFVGEVALGLQGSLAAHGQFVVLANTRDDVATQTEVLDSLLEERAAGIVLIPAVGTESTDLRRVRDSNTPLVLVNRNVPGGGLPFVGTNDREIIRLAVEHLADIHRVREAAYFGGLAQAGPRKARYAAFRHHVEAKGIRNCDLWTVSTGPNAKSAFETARLLLRTGQLPEAIVCHSDSVAAGLLRALDDARVDAAQCAVVSIDGIAASEMTVPPLTTVAVDTAGTGSSAGHLLLTRSGCDPADTAPRPPRLIVRRSCGCPANTQDEPSANNPASLTAVGKVLP